VIYAQLFGLGYDGPHAGRGGFDLIAQGMGGTMHVTGEPNGPPTSVGLPICDLGTGMWAVQGILAALYERQRTGVGRLVECSLLETAIGFSSWTSAQWLADHEELTRQGSRHRQNAPYQRMRTKDGVWPGLQLRADVRRPAGAPPRPRAICERNGIGRSPAHLHPDQDR
jgi:crotonobetainyl-CoA:carnitine CoA-transferase CaiB-like acyl-CoA transferase